MEQHNSTRRLVVSDGRTQQVPSVAGYTKVRPLVAESVSRWRTARLHTKECDLRHDSRTRPLFLLTCKGSESNYWLLP